MRFHEKTKFFNFYLFICFSILDFRYPYKKFPNMKEKNAYRYISYLKSHSALIFLQLGLKLAQLINSSIGNFNFDLLFTIFLLLFQTFGKRIGAEYLQELLGLLRRLDGFISTWNWWRCPTGKQFVENFVFRRRLIFVEKFWRWVSSKRFGDQIHMNVVLGGLQ